MKDGTAHAFGLDIAVLPKIKHLTYKEARQKILEIDDDLCTETFVSNLITYLPNKDDDLKTMEKYLNASEEEKAELNDPEHFTVEVVTIYRYEARLQFMLFRTQFTERYDQLLKVCQDKMRMI